MNDRLSLMANWYERPASGWLIRCGGIALIAIAVLAFAELWQLWHFATPQAATPLALLLAFIGFASASAGCIMASLGRHLFDRIELPNRWRQHDVHRGGRRRL